MSDPPPIPQQVEPIPVEPISAQPAPMPVETLPPLPEGYMEGTWGRTIRRPGIVTAVGIISIVVGSLGIFGGGLSSLYSAIFYMVGQTTQAMANAAAMAPPAQVAAAPSAPAFTPIETEDDGVESNIRSSIIEGLRSARPINANREQQLEALLAKDGKFIVPLSEKGVSSLAVSQSIGSRGRLPAMNGQGEGADYFELPTGRIEVDDDRALFAPNDHSQEVVRVNRPIPGHTLTVTPPPQPVQQPVAMPFNRMGPINGATAGVCIGEGALSLLLSVYLLIIGILVLRDNRRGRRLHAIYIVLKIPLVAACGIAWWNLVEDFFRAVPAANGQPVPTVGPHIAVLMMLVVTPLIYPVALTFTLMAGTVKQYFDGLGKAS